MYPSVRKNAAYNIKKKGAVRKHSKAGYRHEQQSKLDDLFHEDNKATWFLGLNRHYVEFKFRVIV